MLSQLCQSSDTFYAELANNYFYKASISKMSLRFAKLQKLNKKTRKFRITKKS